MKKSCSYCLTTFPDEDGSFSGLYDYCIFIDQDLEDFYLCSICFHEIEFNRRKEIGEK